MTDQKAETRTADEAGGIGGRELDEALAAVRLHTTSVLQWEKALRDGGLEAYGAAKAASAASSLGKSVETLSETRRKIAHAKDLLEGGGGLDLGAALGEVRRRMAVLRRARLAGGAA